MFISDLRRALEPDQSHGAAPKVLVTASPGYLLAVEPAAVDAHAFARPGRAGSGGARRGRP